MKEYKVMNRNEQIVSKEVQKRKVSDIIFRKDLYARSKPDQAFITLYESNIENVLQTKIEIAQNNILIDGYHRWKAAERKYGKDYELDVIVHLTDDLDYIELESYASNTRHGNRNSREDNIRNIRRLYSKGHDIDLIQNKLGLGKTIVYEAISDLEKALKAERDSRIVELYLKAWNTQEQVVDIINTEYSERLHVDQSKISRVLNDMQNSVCGKLHKEWTLDSEDKNYDATKPFHYNIWRWQENKDVPHFGHFPEIYFENILYYHTTPMDIIYDPFAGNGTTVDMCKKWMRRYYCSDRIVKPGREDDIIQHDIADGLPDNLPRPDLTFLDPPYWVQAEGMYSDQPEDLGNMPLEEFYQSIDKLLTELIVKKSKLIAIVIQPTQYKNDLIFEDHIFHFANILHDTYNIEMRYILPYSTQQYTPQCVEKAKEEKVCLGTYRDLVIWRLNND